MGVHRALPADRQVRPVPRAATAAVRGVALAVQDGRQWREMPGEFGAWPTVHNRFRQGRDADVLEALLEGLIAEAAKRGEMDLSLVTGATRTGNRPGGPASVRQAHRLPGRTPGIHPRRWCGS
ncbi:IS1647-like transposase [Streptomyces sparsogenes DSM 40356]|uniref:IS1647-like transposase n=1 Tax=Streptomyces sparsogenes DSM 40356 TaxID=1331668 RepID=A0A1R1S444_9ACTN|nr:IS1647-like transposase [Streptomyces sparsogenes DSM 40356]